MRSRATFFLALGAWLLADNCVLHSQNAPLREYQVKAAIVFNFVKFVEWPASVLPPPPAPIIIGILGDNPFHEELEQMIHNKSVDDHPLLVQEFTSLSQATNVHMLFISNSEKANLPGILKSLKGRSVLTIGEMDRFIETGGMVSFVPEGSKIRFRINNDAASNAHLKISSRLLNIAVR